MTALKKYDLSGNEVGSHPLEAAMLEVSAHSQSIKDYIVAIRNNQRQWSANTKGRKEVNRTGKKPHPQKGQGRSRQGCLAAPHYKGGGIVFGPKPKFDQHVRINRKERRAAIRFLLAEKIQGNQVHILQRADFERPKTARMAQFFDSMQWQHRRVLVLGSHECPEEALFASVRNIPKKEVGSVAQVNGYELARCQELVVLESALDQFLAILT